MSMSQGYCPGLSTANAYSFLQKNLLHGYSWEWRLEQSLKNKCIKAINSAKPLNFIWKFHHSRIVKHSCILILHCNTCVKYKAWLCPLYRMKSDPQKIKATFSKMATNFGTRGIRSILTANLFISTICFDTFCSNSSFKSSQKYKKYLSDVETFKTNGHSLKCKPCDCTKNMYWATDRVGNEISGYSLLRKWNSCAFPSCPLQ